MSDTNEIHELIEKTIAPPGIQKKNRRSIFKTIGDVGVKIKKDALTAFNAHFPYVADEKKLEEHGQALLIPHLLHDGAEEYRNRVATASFFLSKAGERCYIMSQLEAHFGNRYVLSETFLNVYVKVLDISEGDRQWVRQFLDELLNPVIRLTFGDWIKYIEQFPFSDTDRKTIRRIESEQFFHSVVFRDGRILRDGVTVLPTHAVSVFHDGSKQRNAALERKSFYRVPADNFINTPVLHNSGGIDILSLFFMRHFAEDWNFNEKSDALHFDHISQAHSEQFTLNDSDNNAAVMRCTDTFKVSDTISMSGIAGTVTDVWHLDDGLFYGMRYARFRNGHLFRNGYETRKGNILIAL
ncbi:hypothetical protein ACFGOO_03185 [Treponema vincentii]|uniref:hypothetical protein n=1 Tax=Treponema vincentii TaxID=69710 RepID=UPI0035F58808